MTSELAMSPTSLVEDVVLRDGSTLRLRPTVPGDADLLLRFFERLSPESRYLRFQGARRIDEHMVEPFLHTDYESTVSLVGELDGRGGSRSRPTSAPRPAPRRGGVCGRGRPPGTRDRYASAGAAGRARGTGGNRGVCRPGVASELGDVELFRDAGFASVRRLDGGVVEVSLTLGQTDTVLAAIDERDHVAVARSLAPFFNPRSVAVIGASARRGTIGGELFRNILGGDFSGAAYPINVKGDPVGGVPGYASMDEVPEVPDLVVVCVPGNAVLGAADAALRRGVKALCVISAGFAETGARERYGRRSCWRSCAPMVRAWSGRTASASRRRRLA